MLNGFVDHKTNPKLAVKVGELTDAAEKLGDSIIAKLLEDDSWFDKAMIMVGAPQVVLRVFLADVGSRRVVHSMANFPVLAKHDLDQCFKTIRDDLEKELANGKR